MAVVERRTISELATRYKLEPTLRDVYVEGPRDRSVFLWFLSTSGNTDCSVREIEGVEIPSALIEAYGLRPGRRGAVISLALELCRLLDGNLPKVVCIADRDGEDVSAFSVCGCCAFTDFSSVEMYFFEPRVIGKVLAMAAGRHEEGPEEGNH